MIIQEFREIFRERNILMNMLLSASLFEQIFNDREVSKDRLFTRYTAFPLPVEELLDSHSVNRYLRLSLFRRASMELVLSKGTHYGHFHLLSTTFNYFITIKSENLGKTI